MADTLRSGRSGRKVVQVRFLSWAPKTMGIVYEFSLRYTVQLGRHSENVESSAKSLHIVCLCAYRRIGISAWFRSRKFSVRVRVGVPMKGDRHKPRTAFIRWMEATCDGLKDLKGRRVPSLTDKQYERRWRRRQGKKMVR